MLIVQKKALVSHMPVHTAAGNYLSYNKLFWDYKNMVSVSGN